MLSRLVARGVAACLLVASVWIASVALAEEAGAAVKVFKAAKPPVIDGLLDDEAWKDALVTRVNFVHGKLGQETAQPPMLVRFSWDDQYFYIGYETFDENLLALGTGEQDGPKTNTREGAKISDPVAKVDVVEFFLSFGDEHFFWELHHNALNQFNDIFCAVVDDDPIGKTTLARYGIHFGTREYVDDDAQVQATLSMAARPKPKADGTASTINQEGDTDTGYVGELRFPWAGLGAPMNRETWVIEQPATPGGATRRFHGPWKMAGAELKIMSVCQNGDLTDRYHHSSPAFPGGWFHKGAVHWPLYELVDTSPAEKP